MKFSGWTVDEVMALGPCDDYTREVVAKLWAGRERLGIAEVCDLDIPAADRLWLLTQAPWEVIEPAITATVERAVRSHALNCGVAEVEAWAAKWLGGEDRSERAAWAAREAWAAAWAARAAAEAATWAAAAESERIRQIDDFRKLEVA